MPDFGPDRHPRGSAVESRDGGMRGLSGEPPGGWLACSLPAEIGPDDLGLRREADAGELRKRLSEIDIALLADAMRARPS